MSTGEAALVSAEMGVFAGNLVETEATYRVAAIPLFSTIADELILSDASGRTYLLSGATEEPSVLERADADTLGMFFEPSQDSSWHTLSQLRALFYRTASSNSGVAVN